MTRIQPAPPATDIPAVSAEAEAIWAVLAPRFDQLVQHKLDAMQRRIEARLVDRIRSKLPLLHDRLNPLVQRMVKHKNDVQDDAIIGIGAKVDAQEEAIQSLAGHVRQMLAHPIFRR